MTILPHILVIDDDIRLRKLLKSYLSDNGYLVSLASDALEAVRMQELLVFDLLVIDVMMPGENGFSLTRRLRKEKDVPVLLLTAMGESSDRIRGLEAGADDYMAKPFEPRELLLRIASILRRTQVKSDAQAERRNCQFGNFVFDLQRNELIEGNIPIRLTSSEQTLFNILATRTGQIISREELATLTGLEGKLRTVDVQITRLRRRFEKDPRNPRYLQTVRGQGYVLWSD